MQRSRRTPWGTITREQIVSTAVETLREEGFAGVTIRGLASRMGVAPMSLYRHVRGKDDILDEVVDQLLACEWEPAAARADWKAWVTEAAERLRRLLVEQPAALHVYLRHPVVSPSAKARMEAIMGVLAEWLDGPDAARQAYGTLQTYTIGFAALQASRSGWIPPDVDGDTVARDLQAITSDDQFVQGIACLLAGMESGVPAGVKGGAPAG